LSARVGYREAEVVVAGGGTGGTCAAIAAARNGMDVLLVEQNGFLGGLFTGGNMCISTVRPWAGIGKEIFDRLFDMGAATMHPDDPPNYPIFHHRSSAARTVPYDPERAMLVLFQMCEEAGVRLLLHTHVTGVVMEGNAVKGVIVENKSGRQIVMGTIFCDGTGDGDVAASAGAEFTTGLTRDKQSFAMTQLIRLSHVDWKRASEYSKKDPGFDGAIRRAKDELPYYTPRTRDMIPYWGHPRPELARLWYEDGALMWGGTVVDVDGLNVDDLTHAEVEVRKQWMSELNFLRQHIPGFEKARVENSGDAIGVRETRHILGEYVYTGHDFLEAKAFPDTVAYAVPYVLGVPYRCFVPKKIENLLIACKCLSIEPGQASSGPTLGAYNHMKSITTVMSYGEAAGTAAALCVKNEVKPRNLDVPLLQTALTEQGALVGPEVIAELISQKLPSGVALDESFQRRRNAWKRRWQKRGYSFEVPAADEGEDESEPLFGRE
jgi:hypothetical protein